MGMNIWNGYERERCNTKKKTYISFICIICSITLILFDFFKYDIAVNAKYSFGLLIAVGLLSYIPYILYGILLMCIIWYTIKKIRVLHWRTFVPITIVIITILFLTVFPYTNAYVNLYYSLNKGNLHKTIEMVNSGEIQRRTGKYEYVVPYRLTSYSKEMYAHSNNEVTEVLFFVYKGFKKAMIMVYYSDDSGVKENDFSAIRNPRNIKKVDDNWYSAICYY